MFHKTAKMIPFGMFPPKGKIRRILRVCICVHSENISRQLYRYTCVYLLYDIMCVCVYIHTSLSKLTSLLEKHFQFSSVAQSCPTLCDSMNHSTPSLFVHHQLLGFTQTHVHWVGDAIQPSHPLSSPSSPAPHPSQHQSLFQWVNSLHEVAKVLEFQLQHQSFQWTPRTDFL